MSDKTLLLNSSYETLSFVNNLKAVSLILNDKVEIMSEWDDFIIHPGGKFKIPSILKMKYLVKRKYAALRFTKNAVFRRDQFSCQYCMRPLDHSSITMDHIIPKSKGGDNSFLNCVAACKPCNTKKGNKLPEESGMKLMSQPFIPKNFILTVNKNELWHSDWAPYIRLK